MAKKRVHVITVRVIFDKPVGQTKAIAEIRHVLPRTGHYTAPDLVDGATCFKLAGISLVRDK